MTAEKGSRIAYMQVMSIFIVVSASGLDEGRGQVGESCSIVETLKFRIIQ